jgi:hypothetical protein
MTVQHALATADALRPNAFDKTTKLEWLATLDGTIALEVHLMSEEDAQAFRYKSQGDTNTELLVKYPYDDLYTAFLVAKIDEANGEYERYANSAAMYNERRRAYTRFYAQTYAPAQR